MQLMLKVFVMVLMRTLSRPWVNGFAFLPPMLAVEDVSVIIHVLYNVLIQIIALDDLKLVDKLSNGKVDLTFGR
jgi:hypothetical protein